MAPDLTALKALSEPIIEQDWPTPTCPHCDRGLIVFARSNTHMGLQPWSDHEREGWDPEDVEGVFAVLGTCSAATCGGHVMISGTYRVRSQQRRRAGDPDHVYAFSVLQAAPAFGLITPPAALPDSIRGSIGRAERLLLPDRASAAGALRAAVERLLSEQGIPNRTRGGGFKSAEDRIAE
jgi:nitroreductase